MHVQNREFKNTGFLPIWVFDSQQLEDHRMQRSMVRLSQTTRKCTVIMLLCYYLLVLCIPILFLSISYPCIVGILQFKRALTELLLLQIVVKENLAWFVPLLLHRRPPQLSCSDDRRVQHSRDPASRLSFAASDLLPRRWQP